jgi:phosphate:Na+ symporter
MENPESIVGAVGWMIGGLGIFLFGIHMLSQGVRDVAGQRLRRLIAQVTRFPPIALLVGALLTGLMQSSSAFSVMIVSFVQAGLLTFRQSIALILGSAIGSTVTAQLLANVLDTNILESVSLPLAGAGLLMVLFAHRRRTVCMGRVIFGFGAVFLGFIFMRGAVSHWQDTVVRDAFTHFSEPGWRPMSLGMLAGLAATAIVQSSGATIGILQNLASEGVVPSLAVAIPIVIGCQVGTAITAVLASIGASADAKRVAGVNVLYRLLGGAVALAVLPLSVRLIPLTATELHIQIANFHTMQSILIAFLFLPFAGALAWLLQHLLRGGERVSAAPQFLDYTGESDLIDRTQQACQELMRLLGLVSTMPLRAVESLFELDESAQRRVLQDEETVDVLDETLHDFLVALEQDVLAEDVSREELFESVRVTGIHLMQALHHCERVADHAENIVELAGFEKPLIKQVHVTTGETLLDLAARAGAFANQVAQCIEHGAEDALIRIAIERSAFRMDCRQLLQELHQQVRQAGQAPIIAMIAEEIVVNMESSVNHLRKAANAYYGRPMQPTHLDAEE